MYKIYVALRYLRKNWLNFVGIAAVAIAVMVPICVLSVMKGFDQEIRARLRDTLSDVIVEPWSDTTFADYLALMAKIERLPHVRAVSPEYNGLGIVMFGKQTRFAQFRGVDLSREVHATDFAQYYRTWRAHVAREQLDQIFPPQGERLSTLGSADISTALEHLDAAADATSGKLAPDPSALRAQLLRAIASQLRSSDYDRLPSRLRSALAAAARKYGVSLDAMFKRAEAAMPSWKGDLKPDEAPVFIGRELGAYARDLSGRIMYLDVSQPLVIIIPTSETDDTSRVFQKGRIVGEFQSGMYDYDERTIVLPIESVGRRLRKPGHATAINIRLDDFANAPKVRAALLGIMTLDEINDALSLMDPILTGSDRKPLDLLRPALQELRAHNAEWIAADNPQMIPVTFEVERNLFEALRLAVQRTEARPRNSTDLSRLKALHASIQQREQQAVGRDLRVSTWEDKRRSTLRAVQVERKIQAFVLFFVTLVSGFLILTILHTTVLVKTKDIGILKALGGTVRGIMALFLINGGLIGVFGALIGSVAGMLITKNLHTIEEALSALFHFRLFPPDIYYLDQIPVDKDPLPSAIIISLVAIAISFLASALPAWKASRLDAVEALRYE